MKITTRDDINAPIEFVYAQVTDFVSLERQALRRGADVKRLDTMTEPGIGSSWRAGFVFRNKPRQVEVHVLDMAAPHSLRAGARSGGLETTVLVELVAFSRSQTRLSLMLDLKPSNLTSRLLVQSLKLARGRVTARLQTRVTAYAQDIEERYRRRSGAAGQRQV